MFTLLLLLLVIFFLRIIYFYFWQKQIWTWHCKNVYPFHEHLTPLEQEYIQACMKLSWCELLRPFLLYRDPLLSRLSFFSYSSRIKENRVRSGRIAYGSAVRPEKAYQYAQAVLKERKIPIVLDTNVTFGGLGWDLEEKTFRVYLRCKDVSKLDTQMKKGEGEGGIAWTYDEAGKKIEEKIYTFPEKVTKMKSSRRGIIPQYDDLPVHLPEKAQELVRFYKKHGYFLDTYAKDGEEYTLYFPKIK